MERKIVTVSGPIEPSEMGLTLPHEHIIVDFIGAVEAGPHRYNRSEVVKTMLPFLQEIVALGVKSFVECTPMYMARDPVIFRELSERTGLNILTNTGQYKEPSLPQQTLEINAEELAAQWILEWEEGIDGTDVRPGFIKTAVEPEPLAPIQQKVIRAAAITSRATGLTIMTHTCVAEPALQVLDILEEEGVDPSRWIFTHAQQEEDLEQLTEVARRGAWISLDGLKETLVNEHMRSLLHLLELGFRDHILLSHDAGCYTVGEGGGGEKRPYTYLFNDFIPLLRERGVDQQTIDRIVTVNPSEAFIVR
jgi:phosphotriesterase-related protein